MGFKIDQTRRKSKINHAIPPVDFQHILCEGATGTGKTASLILPTLEDRLKRGHTIIFFDHKGHEHKKVKYLAQKAGRLSDVVEIGKPHTAYINLLAELDTIRLKEMVGDNGMSKDPYWSNSAANLVEDIIAPLRKLYDIVKEMGEYGFIASRNEDVLHDLKEFGIDIHQKPSFQTLALIISSPKHLSSYKNIISKIPLMIEPMLKFDYRYTDRKTSKIRQLYAKILSLQKSIDAAERFTVSEYKSEMNSGNNAVLQTLDNTISSYAKKDYINIDEYTVTNLMDSNAIIIIDTQSFANDIMKVFLESILKKAVMRLRTGTHKPMSVFIDEANRVLFPSIDLHNDVLREAAVELILAIQNEEQMVNKFSKVGWDSIKGNIKHRYVIDLDHRIRYNDGELMTVKPLLPEPALLKDADHAYYALEKNKTNLQKNFLAKIDELPEKFTVNYDLDLFEHASTITLEDKYGDVYAFSYHGEEIINKVNETYPESPVTDDAFEIDYPSLFDIDEDQEERDEDGIDYDFDDPIPY